MDAELAAEREAFHALASTGGRPIHPVELLQTVLTAPGQYRDILAYWQDRPDECVCPPSNCIGGQTAPESRGSAPE